MIEHGPESILTAKRAGRDLAVELGLESELQSTRQHVSGAFVLKAGELLRIPEGFSMMAPSAIRPFLTSRLLSWPAKLRVLAEPFVRKKTTFEDESLAAFVRRRLGDEVLQRIAQPMVAGIYGADPETLSLAASMPRFIDLEREHGSLVRGLRKHRNENEGAAGARYKMFFSFRNGMQTLIDALTERIGRSLHLNHGVSALCKAKSGWKLVANGQEKGVDQVIVALPAARAAELLDAPAPELAEGLRQIPYGRGAAITLAYDCQQIRHPLDAYGFVVPRVEPASVIACTFMHQKWAGRAPAAKALLRAFVVDDTSEQGSDALVQLAHTELSQWLGIDGQPEQSWVSRYLPSTPHYILGHQERTKRLFDQVARLEGLYLIGNAYRGVGIPDSIALANKIALKIAETCLT